MFRLKLCRCDGRRRSRPGDRNAGAGKARLSRPDQRLVHHGRRDRRSHRSGPSCRSAASSKIFRDGEVPTAAISFFPAGRRRNRTAATIRVSGRWRFNSGIRHAEWVLGGTVVDRQRQRQWRTDRHVLRVSREGRDAARQLGRRHRTARHRLGRFLGRQDYYLPEDLTFVWDLLEAEAVARRTRPTCLPPFSYVAKEHGSVAHRRVRAARSTN